MQLSHRIYSSHFMWPALIHSVNRATPSPTDHTIACALHTKSTLPFTFYFESGDAVSSQSVTRVRAQTEEQTRIILEKGEHIQIPQKCAGSRNCNIRKKNPQQVVDADHLSERTTSNVLDLNPSSDKRGAQARNIGWPFQINGDHLQVVVYFFPLSNKQEINFTGSKKLQRKPFYLENKSHQYRLIFKFILKNW